MKLARGVAARPGRRRGARAAPPARGSASRDVAPAATTRAPTRRASIVIALFSVDGVRLALDCAQTGQVTGMLLLASEALVVVLTVFRRPPATVDRSVAGAAC